MVGEQMLSRLEYVHSKSFLHRDVKPDNLMVTADDHLLLVGFGGISILTAERGND